MPDLRHSIHIYEDEIETLEAVLAGLRWEDPWEVHGYHATVHITAWKERIALLKSRLREVPTELPVLGPAKNAVPFCEAVKGVKPGSRLAKLIAGMKRPDDDE